MRAPDWPAAVTHVTRQLDITSRLWTRAVDAADEHDGSGPSPTGVRARGSSSSPTERDALRETRQMAELARRVTALERAASAVSTFVAHLAPPQARMVNGRAVSDCGNVLGCPEGKAAAREGLCNPCWWFRHATGRARAVADVAEQLERARMGTRDRVAKHRSKQ